MSGVRASPVSLKARGYLCLALCAFFLLTGFDDVASETSDIYGDYRFQTELPGLPFGCEWGECRGAPPVNEHILDSGRTRGADSQFGSADYGSYSDGRRIGAGDVHGVFPPAPRGGDEGASGDDSDDDTGVGFDHDDVAGGGRRDGDWKLRGARGGSGATGEPVDAPPSQRDDVTRGDDAGVGDGSGGGQGRGRGAGVDGAGGGNSNGGTGYGGRGQGEIGGGVGDQPGADVGEGAGTSDVEAPARQRADVPPNKADITPTSYTPKPRPEPNTTIPNILSALGYAVLFVLLILVLAAIARYLRDRQSTATPTSEKASEEQEDELLEGLRQRTESKSPEQLVAEHRYEDAIHAMLLAALSRVITTRQELGQLSLTAREILRRASLDAELMAHLRRLVHAAELCIFADVAADAEMVQRCRGDFDALMNGLAERGTHGEVGTT